MSNELDTYQSNTVAVEQDTMQTQAVRRLGEWAHAAGAAFDVAKGLVGTSFVPAQFKNKPEEATAAILSGAEVGLSPMASLKSFDIIQGVAAPRALTLRAIVQSQGHEMILDETNGTRCIMRGRRRGTSEWVKVSWTLDRAKGLGLTGKDNWKKQPGAMLVARATGELARLIAADAILGIGYAVEELTDGDVGDAPELAEPTPTKRTMQRKAKAETPEKDEPEPTDVSDAEIVPEPAEPTDITDGITKEQSKKLHASFGELGIADRDDRLAYAAKIVDRELASSADLTKAEASTVIEALVFDLEQQAEQVVADSLPTDGEVQG